MAAKIDAQMPENVVVGDGWRIEWAAVNPTTGADVAGVVVSDANVVATELQAAKPFADDPPLLTHEPQE